MTEGFAAVLSSVEKWVYPHNAIGMSFDASVSFIDDIKSLGKCLTYVGMTNFVHWSVLIPFPG